VRTPKDYLALRATAIPYRDMNARNPLQCAV
jgi:hypothetical protein